MPKANSAFVEFCCALMAFRCPTIPSSASPGLAGEAEGPFFGVGLICLPERDDGANDLHLEKGTYFASAQACGSLPG